MALVTANKKNIKEASRIIKAGGLVAFPTETVYGLGANALDPVAITKIFEAKNRPFFDPIIIHVASVNDAKRLVDEFGEKAMSLAKAFWPGPLTIVLQKSDSIPEIATAGLDTVAIRIPDNDIALALIEESGTPIAAPSANPFGYISPTSAEHVSNQLGDKVDMILDGGMCKIGIESTIIDAAHSLILRTGGLPIEDINELIGDIEIMGDNGEGIRSPGKFPSHYAPCTPLKIVDSFNNIHPKDKKAGLLAFKVPTLDPDLKRAFKSIEILSTAGDLNEAAANFFSCLHTLDDLGLDIIYAESVPEKGLGRAIMERLYKASKK